MPRRKKRSTVVETHGVVMARARHEAAHAVVGTALGSRSGTYTSTGQTRGPRSRASTTPRG